MDVNVVVAALMIWIFAMILIFGFQLYDLYKRILTLEREVYIYLNSKVKEIVEQATLKEGDN